MGLDNTAHVGDKKRGAVPTVVLQHTEDASALHGARSLLVSAPHVRIQRIRRFDDRIAAHLHGLMVAKKHCWETIDASLETPSQSKVFTAAVTAIACNWTERLNWMYSLAEAVPSLTRGLLSAFGWAERSQLTGVVSSLLASRNAFSSLLGISACAVHRVDPGKALYVSLESRGHACCRSLRTAGELGRRDLAPLCSGMLAADEEDIKFWAAWSVVLLGNRGSGLQILKTISGLPGKFQKRAFRLTVQALEQRETRDFLHVLSRRPESSRLLIQGTGIAGDARYVPWLIEKMGNLNTARIAGEAFALITGLDLAYLDLDKKPPEDTGAGPNDDPDDPNVDMDEDDGLPWPDPERISKWWASNGSRFTAGTRYFMGAPVDRDNCLRVLKDGFQRQRILAAHYLCLLEPGTPLFEWRAPAYRQQRLLASMS